MERIIGYGIAVLGPFAIVSAAIAYLEAHRPGGQWNSNTTTVLLAAAGVATTQLVNIMNSRFNSKKLDHLHDCIEERVTEVKKETQEATKIARENKVDILSALSKSDPNLKRDPSSIHDMHVDTMHVAKVDKK